MASLEEGGYTKIKTARSDDRNGQAHIARYGGFKASMRPTERPAGTSSLPVSHASIHERSHWKVAARLIGVHRMWCKHSLKTVRTHHVALRMYAPVQDDAANKFRRFNTEVD